jgi:putative ABC transport system permease protein
MLALQRRLSVGYLRQHPTRAILIVISIALGVATLVATRLLNQSVNQQAPEAVNPLAKLADLIVMNAQTGVPRDLAGQLEKAYIPGLRDAQPVVLGRVTLPQLDKNGRSVWLFGLDWMAARAAAAEAGEDNPWGIEIHWRERPDSLSGLVKFLRRTPALVGEQLDRDLSQAVPGGDGEFEALAASKKRDLTVIGTVRFRDTLALSGGNFVIMDVRQAAPLIFPQRPENVSQINIRVEPGADVEQVRRRVQDYVGDQAEVRTLDSNYQTARDVTGGLELGFDIGGAIALVVGLFLVYNVLSVSVAERRHDIGILRSVGATRGQVARLFLGEAVLLGLAGSLLGLPLGYGLGWLVLRPALGVISDLFVPMEETSLQMSAALMLIAVAAGVSTAVLAALVPSVHAASEEPADAVRRVPRRPRVGYRVLHLAAVSTLLAAGVASVVGRSYLPNRAGVFAGAILLFLSGLVVIPLVTELLGRLLQPVARLCLGTEARLAADNLVRSPGRTGIVIAALATTGGLVFGLAGLIYTTKATVLTWLDESIAADLFLTCGGPISSASLTQPMDEKIGREIKSEVSEVEAAVGIRFHLLDFRDRFIFMLAMDSDAFPQGAQRSLARNLAKYPRLREGGTVLVSENFAAQYDVRTGDRISIRGRHGPLELEVIGTMVDYTWSRGTLLVDRGWFKREFGDNMVDIYDVYLRPGSDPEAVRERIEARWGKKEALYGATRAEVHRGVEDGLTRVYTLGYAQAFIVGLVTLLGVVSALFISVLQRRRELGLLRAVGASRGQVLGTVVAEAALMGLIGGLLGFLMGVVFEWYIVRLILFTEAGLVFPLLLPWLAAGVIFGLSWVLAALVGLWPAYHATRLRIADAIAYE